MTFKAIVESLKLSATVELVQVINEAILKSIADGASTTDEIILQVTKALQDQANTSDALSFDVSKLIQDTAVLQEVVKFNVSKVLAETANMSDAFSKISEFNRAFSDTSSMAESITKSLSTIFTDSANASESGYTFEQDYTVDYYFAGDYVGTRTHTI